jgi:hypothetical protein
MVVCPLWVKSRHRVCVKKRSPIEATSKERLRLSRQTLNDEGARLCGFVSYCADFFEVFRAIEGFRFIDAIELIGYEPVAPAQTPRDPDQSVHDDLARAERETRNAAGTISQLFDRAQQD